MAGRLDPRQWEGGGPAWPKAAVRAGENSGSDRRRQPASLRRVQLFPRVLDLRDRLKLDIGELAVNPLDTPHIDILNDVAGLRVNRDRPARAVRSLPGLEERHRLI